jgi:hypothetical protein
MVYYTLSIEEFLYAIEQFYKESDALEGIKVDGKNSNCLFDVLMTINR